MTAIEHSLEVSRMNRRLRQELNGENRSAIIDKLIVAILDEMLLIAQLTEPEARHGLPQVEKNTHH